MIFSVAHLIWHLSHYLVLEPGDIVNTGTPQGVALSGKFPYLQTGDVMRIGIETLGSQEQLLVPAARELTLKNVRRQRSHRWGATTFASALTMSASKPAAAALARWRSMKFRQLFSSPRARASSARERSRGSSWSTKPGSVGTAASRSIAACASCWSRADPRRTSSSTRNGGGPSAPDHVAALVRAVHDCPRHFDGTIEITGAGLLHRKLGVDDRQTRSGRTAPSWRPRGLE